MAIIKMESTAAARIGREDGEAGHLGRSSRRCRSGANAFRVGLIRRFRVLPSASPQGLCHLCRHGPHTARVHVRRFSRVDAGSDRAADLFLVTRSSSVAAASVLPPLSFPRRESVAHYRPPRFLRERVDLSSVAPVSVHDRSFSRARGPARSFISRACCQRENIGRLTVARILLRGVSRRVTTFTIRRIDRGRRKRNVRRCSQSVRHGACRKPPLAMTAALADGASRPGTHTRRRHA